MTMAPALAALVLVSGFGPVAAAPVEDARTVLTRTISIERQQPAASVPLEVRAGKLFLDASVNGQSRSFIFDSGSPTIITRDFADALGLKAVAQNTGVDANGAKLSMDIAVLNSLSFGGVTFRGVPVMIFDFSGLPLGPCFVDGGMIGSEVLPGSSWRIDLENKRLTIAQSANAAPISAGATAAQLYDFGYPHAPVVGYSIGSYSDKALFDTGNSEEVTLFRKVFDDPTVQEAIVAGSLREGRGSEGESAGGRGAATDLFRFDLSGLRVDGQSLPDMPAIHATTRGAPPSLLGARLLDSYVVTLDYPGGRILFEPRHPPGRQEAKAGYAIGMVGDNAEVVQLFDGSPAMKTGLRLGDRVLQVGGRALEASTRPATCQSAKWLAETFDSSAPAELVILRDGKRFAVHVPGGNPQPR